MSLKIIMKEDSEAEAFIESIINQTANRIAGKLHASILIQQEQRSGISQDWLNTEEAMKYLKVGKNTMQKLRDESPMNGIVITQVSDRNFLYSQKSLHEYLEKRRLK